MSQAVEYMDFAVRIASNKDGNLKVRLVSSPYCIGTDEFDVALPPSVEKGVHLLSMLEQKAESGLPSSPGSSLTERHVSPEGRPASTLLHLQNFGSQLFETIFGGPLHESFITSLAYLEDRGDRGLRIRLEFDLSNPLVVRLASLPWEALYRRDAPGFLALDVRTPIVRFIETPNLRVPPRNLEGPLRILVAIASPQDFPELDVEREVREIERTWEGSRQVTVKSLRRVTLEKLRAAVRQSPLDVFHFIGHGDFAENSEESQLVFETPSRTPHRVPAAMLSATLRSNHRPRLAILNACETARFPRESGRSPFSGSALALLKGGLPAAVAMQTAITDDSAIIFSKAFYSALAAGDGLDTAVTEGRLAIQSSSPGPEEWIIPSVFTAVRDCKIFDIRQPQRTDHMPKYPEVSNVDNRSYSGTFHGPTNFAEGDIHYHSGPSPEGEAQRFREEGMLHLASGAYRPALKAFRASLEQQEGDPEIRYYLCLALLARRRPRALHRNTVSEMEENLLAVLHRAPQTQHARILLAALKQDYYQGNRLRVPHPSAQELLGEVAQASLSPGKLAELRQHLPAIGGPVGEALSNNK